MSPLAPPPLAAADAFATLKTSDNPNLAKPEQVRPNVSLHSDGVGIPLKVAGDN